MGSNQLQIHNLLNTTNREPTPTRQEGRKNIYYQIPVEVYQDKKETPRRVMTWDKAHHYPGSIEYEDIRIALNKVDSWIDMLNANYLSKTYKSPTTASSDIPMMWLLQQSLPRMEVPKFNGNPMKWVEFVIKFKELAHDQVYLIVNQRFIFLMQHMEDEAKRALQVFLTNKNGYILALKRLKYIYVWIEV